MQKKSLKKAETDLAELRSTMEAELAAKGKAEKGEKKAKKLAKELQDKLDNVKVGVGEEIVKKLETQVSELNSLLGLEKQARATLEKSQQIRVAELEELKISLEEEQRRASNFQKTSKAFEMELEEYKEKESEWEDERDAKDMENKKN